MAAGPKIFSRQHILPVQRGHDLVPSGPAVRRDLEYHILEVVPLRFVVCDERETVKPRKGRVVGAIVTAVGRDYMVDSVEIDESMAAQISVNLAFVPGW